MENKILTERGGNKSNFTFTFPFTTKQFVVTAFEEAALSTILGK
jgi:hypothetical protein